MSEEKNNYVLALAILVLALVFVFLLVISKPSDVDPNSIDINVEGVFDDGTEYKFIQIRKTTIDEPPVFSRFLRLVYADGTALYINDEYALADANKNVVGDTPNDNFTRVSGRSGITYTAGKAENKGWDGTVLNPEEAMKEATRIMEERRMTILHEKGYAKEKGSNRFKE